MNSNERAPPPRLYDPIVTDQVDGTQPGVAHRPQDHGAIIGGGFNTVEGLQNARHESLSSDSVGGPGTNLEAPRQYRRVYATQGNRHTSSPAPSTNGESSNYRAFVTERHATSAPSLHPGLLTAPTASGQQPAHRPTIHPNAIRPQMGRGHTSGGNRFQSASVPHGTLAQRELLGIHGLWDANKAIGTSEVPSGTGIFASLMAGDLQHLPWGDDESEGSADPQKEGQAAVDAQDRRHCATTLDRRTADVTNNNRYVGLESGPLDQRMEHYASMARETLEAFDAGEANPI